VFGCRLIGDDSQRALSREAAVMAASDMHDVEGKQIKDSDAFGGGKKYKDASIFFIALKLKRYYFCK